MIKTHRDLDVWKKSILLASEVYTVTVLFPKSEMYGLTSQIRRAAVSIPSNIAEGATRKHKSEFTFTKRTHFHIKNDSWPAQIYQPMKNPSIGKVNDSPLTTHQSPLTSHRAPLTTHHSPVTNHSFAYSAANRAPTFALLNTSRMFESRLFPRVISLIFDSKNGVMSLPVIPSCLAFSSA